MDEKKLHLIKLRLEQYLSLQHSDADKIKKGQFVLFVLNSEIDCFAYVIPTQNKSEVKFIVDAIDLLNKLNVPRIPNVVIYGKVIGVGDFVASEGGRGTNFIIPLSNKNVLLNRKYFRNYENLKSKR